MACLKEKLRRRMSVSGWPTSYGYPEYTMDTVIYTAVLLIQVPVTFFHKYSLLFRQYAVLLFSFHSFYSLSLAHTRPRHWRPLRPRPSLPARHRGRCGYGPLCRYRACRHCGGKHWHRDCPRKPKKTVNKGSDGRALAAPDTQLTSNVDDVGAALFAQSGSASVAFAVPSEGLALCTRDVGDSHVSVSPLRRPDFASFPRSPSELSIEA
eukprot:6211466-Pleurochrysis_carterae.AAC.4